MADKHQRIIPIEDTLLLSMVTQKGEMVEQGRAIAKQMEELTKQHDKLSGDMEALSRKLNNHKLSIFRRLYKLARKSLTEYEIPVTTEIRDGKLVLLVTDALTEFKETFQGFDPWKEPVPRKKKLDPK